MGLLHQLTKLANEYSSEDINKDYEQILIQNEIVELGFKLSRDTFIFTDKRLILTDVQGITGNKIEYLSLSYKNISKFSIETAGTFDIDTELKIWTSGETSPTINKKFNKKIDVYEVQRFLASKVL